MKGDIIDWIRELRKIKGDNLANGFESNKSKDREVLVRLNLPVHDELELPYPKFKENNSEIISFLSKYKSFMIRAIPPYPNPQNLPKDARWVVKSFKECKEFLEKTIPKGTEEEYSTFLTEYEKSLYGGIIISRRKDLLFEIGERLDKLAHSEEIPSISCKIDLTGTGHLEDKIQWETEESKENFMLMKKVLKYIGLGRDGFNLFFTRGYFEFIITETDKVIFLDYKGNESYLR